MALEDILPLVKQLNVDEKRELLRFLIGRVAEDEAFVAQQPVNFFASMLALSDQIQLDLPEDFSERLDDYLYGNYHT